MASAFEKVFEYVQSLEIIDTHEHLPGSEDARERETDVLKEYLQQYFSCDLISAGLSPSDYLRVCDHSIDLMERWELVEEHYENARNTGYGRALDIAAKGLYGIDRICRDTIEELNSAFQESLKPGHFKKVLRDKSNIRIGLLNSDLDCDREFFRSVYCLDNFVYPENYQMVVDIEKQTGVKICSFSDWLRACEVALDKALDKGAVALKSALAYNRTLKYEKATRSDAERGVLEDVFINKHWSDWATRQLIVNKAFQDYMMHFILRMANERGLVFQFHTGLQEGNGNLITNSNPVLMTNLFMEYPDVDFDIFHIGYPYYNELSVLAKMFPNVYIDMCWAHIISPTASVNSLIEWLDSVPANKISAFGGDYWFIDGVYGHQWMARENVSRSLAAKIDCSSLNLDRAKELAQMLFYSNPMKIFKLEGKL